MDGFRPGHEPNAAQGAGVAPQPGSERISDRRVRMQSQVSLKSQQFVMHHPKHKYGVLLAVAVIDGVEKTYAGSIAKDGTVKKWWGIPTPAEGAPSLFAQIKKDLERG